MTKSSSLCHQTPLPLTKKVLYWVMRAIKSGRSTVLGLTIVGRPGGRAAAALLTLLMPVAPLSAFGSAAGDASGLAAVCLDVCGSCKLALLP